MILYAGSIKYETWVKILLGFPIVLVIAMGLYFYNIARLQQGISAVTVHGFHVASIVLFATAPFILFIYWLVLPTKIFIHQDKIKIKYGQFYWNVRYETIECLKTAKGIPPVWSNSSVTSYRNQIEIVRIKKMNIRLSPDNRDQFLDHANRALSDWKRTHGS
ncbi:MAG: hypothetical protein JSV17_15765 [Candidatus Aminicenantes bacterium]|nr:MAG: hypothetical protein JSV17_15765 [Candidatus Aminicenantes bacterium]